MLRNAFDNNIIKVKSKMVSKAFKGGKVMDSIDLVINYIAI